MSAHLSKADISAIVVCILCRSVFAENMFFVTICKDKIAQKSAKAFLLWIQQPTANSARIYRRSLTVLAKTSPKRSFSVIENESFGLVFAKTGSRNSDTGSNQKAKIFRIRQKPF